MSRKYCVILLNVIPFAVFAGLYQFGGNVGLWMPFPQLLITVINTRYAGAKKEIFIYNGILLISSVAGIFVNSQLYFKYICYDVEGVMVMLAEILAAVIVIIIFTTIEFMIRYVYDKMRDKNV